MSRLAAAVCAALTITSFATTRAQESTRDDFLAYAESQTGRWVGEVTWVADWPGLGKKGEKVTAYWEAKMTEDGNAVVGRFFAGSGSATTLVYFDAGSKEIIATTVTSGGTIWRSVISRQSENKFTSRLTGSNPDGDRIESKNTLTISEGGKKGTWTGSGKVGDEPTTLNDTWRRVSGTP